MLHHDVMHIEPQSLEKWATSTAPRPDPTGSQLRQIATSQPNPLSGDTKSAFECESFSFGSISIDIWQYFKTNCRKYVDINLEMRDWKLGEKLMSEGK